MNDAMSVRMILPDLAVVEALARSNLLDLLVTLVPDADVVFTDIVACEAMCEQDEEISARIGKFMRAQSHRIRIDTTAFGDLIKSAMQDESVQLPQRSADLSIYAYLSDVELRHPRRRLMVLLSDDWFRRNEAGAKAVGLTPLTEFLGLARAAGLLP